MFLRFLLVGGIGFCVDGAITHMLVVLDVASWLARIPAIALAMVYTWVANRHFTYKVTKEQSTREALRYAVVSATMAATNYAIYLVLVRFGIFPVAAVAGATACQVTLSFHAYRYFVFGGVRRV